MLTGTGIGTAGIVPEIDPETVEEIETGGTGTEIEIEKETWRRIEEVENVIAAVIQGEIASKRYVTRCLIYDTLKLKK